MKLKQVLSTAAGVWAAATLPAAGAANEPAATRAADPAYEAVPVAVKAELTPKLRAAVAEAQAQVRAGAEPAARKTLETAVEEALAKLDADGDPAVTLRAAADDARRQSADRAAVDRLQGGVAEAIYAMDFKPILEAPLPEGFPSPGPVAKVVVKEYPAYRLAKTSMASADQDKPFMTLFRHIQANDIAMTAPVEMTYKPAADGKPVAPQSMAFLYRSTRQGTAGQQGAVEVADVPAATVASVGVRGNYTDARMADAVARLDRWLAANADRYERAGDPRYMGYNSPFVLPWMRYGEVQVPVRKK